MSEVQPRAPLLSNVARGPATWVSLEKLLKMQNLRPFPELQNQNLHVNIIDVQEVG